MRALLAAGLLLVAFALPVAAADPYLTLDTPGPYHYGQTITVTAHGDIPGRPGEKNAKSWIVLACTQPTENPNVYTEIIESPAAETPYTMHLGQWGLSTWDLNGGGSADCSVRLAKLAHWPNAGTVYTRLFFHVEA
jgi:hypothetical protein